MRIAFQNQVILHLIFVYLVKISLIPPWNSVSHWLCQGSNLGRKYSFTVCVLYSVIVKQWNARQNEWKPCQRGFSIKVFQQIPIKVLTFFKYKKALLSCGTPSPAMAHPRARTFLLLLFLPFSFSHLERTWPYKIYRIASPILCKLNIHQLLIIVHP